MAVRTKDDVAENPSNTFSVPFGLGPRPASAAKNSKESKAVAKRTAMDMHTTHPIVSISEQALGAGKSRCCKVFKGFAPAMRNESCSHAEEILLHMANADGQGF